MVKPAPPTQRELDILHVLWQSGEATVRDVYLALRERLPIVQNTVQALLRTMEEKGLVRHRLEGRTFIYRPVRQRDDTTRQLAGQLLERAFDGAIDQLVRSVLEVRQPTPEELDELEALIARLKAGSPPGGKGQESRT